MRSPTHAAPLDKPRQRVGEKNWKVKRMKRGIGEQSLVMNFDSFSRAHPFIWFVWLWLIPRSRLSIGSRIPEQT